MSTHKYNTRFLRKRRMLLVLPVLVLPFITLMFWSLGGGNGNHAVAQQAKPKGLNVELPDPEKEDQSSLSKLAFYEKADKDSIRFNELIKNDPYYRNEAIQRNETKATTMLTSLSGDRDMKMSDDPLESKVYNKLNELNKHLESSTVESSRTQPRNNLETGPVALATADVDRLEGMMRMMKDDKLYTDPEMQQLDQMLEKIIAIQHPENTKVRSEAPADTTNISRTSAVVTPQVFYTSDADEAGKFQQGSIQSEVNNTQVLVNGSTIKLILLQDAIVKNTLLPKGTKVFGTCTFDNERLRIQVSSIRHRQSIVNVRMQAYDLDGLPGLYIPGNINGDVLAQSTNDLTQTFGMSSMDPSFAAKATDAGISVARSMLAKKMKPVKVTVKAGYQLLLVNAQ